MDDIEFLSQLSEEPDLRKHFEEILKLSSNEGNRFQTADEAEEKTVEALRKLGSEVLQSWGSHREELLSKRHDKSSELEKDGKKSSIGKAVLAKSK